MIGTIRKHTAWLWWIIVTLMVISLIWWGASPGTRNGGGRGNGLGTIYGKPVTAEQFDAARREFYLYFLRRAGEFPERNPNITPKDIERETYIRLLLTAKAKQLGIYVSEEAQQADAVEYLGQLFGREGQVPPMSTFVEKVLAPEGLTAVDFQRYIVDDLQIEQFVQSLGLSGSLVTPQEANQLFDREHQDVSAQAVFFSATNYLARVTANPAEVSHFYTNFMAHYRLPDRVQINYVQFDLTNYLAAAEAKEGKTNITAEVDSVFAKQGAQLAPDAKSPEEAKTKIREMILRRNAAAIGAEKALDFVRVLFAMDPVNAANLIALAKTDGLTVHTTAPFTKAEGPDEFAAPAELTETAFKLNDESPFSKPIPAAETVYVIGLNKIWPSAIPPFSEIQNTVVADYKNYQAAMAAQAAGTNFYYNAVVQMAAGKTFAQTAIAAGLTPVALKPFSLSTRDVPEAEGHTTADAIKQVAFTTPAGHISTLQPSADGGFVLYVQSMLPLDEKLKSSDFPKYYAQVREGRQQEAFNIWLTGEAGRELRNVPDYESFTARKTAPGGQ